MGKCEFGLCSVVGGMTAIALVAYAMRSVCGRIAAVEGGDGNEGSGEREGREAWKGKHWLRNDGEEKV